MESTAAPQLAVLGHPQRLALFRLLMRRYPDHVPATELATALDVKPNTLSVYVGALLQAGLVTQERRGTSRLYAVNLPSVRQLFDHLLNDCCRGRPDICAPLATAMTARTGARDAKFNVLFLCTGNSARSIFAEAILRTEAGARFNAFSAGSNPRSALNPFAVETLRLKGHDTTALRAKHQSEFQQAEAPQFDFVFTLCDQAANEDCPAWAGQPISAHWGMPDPVKAEGSDAQKSLAFQDTFRALRNRILAFAALPVESLDAISLQQAVDTIGRMEKDNAT